MKSMARPFLPSASPHPCPSLPPLPPSASLDSSEDLVPWSAVGSGQPWPSWDVQITGTARCLESSISTSWGGYCNKCSYPIWEERSGYPRSWGPLEEEMTKPDMRVSGLYDGILLEQEARDKFLRGETGRVMGLPPLGPGGTCSFLLSSGPSTHCALGLK